MRRTRLRAALLLVVTAGLGGIGVLVSRNMAVRRTDLLRELEHEVLPEVAQRIQNFKRVKVEGGRTMWQITAKDAQYFEKTRQIVVREPEMTFFMDGGTRRTRVAGAEGRIRVKGRGREVRTLTLRGNVVLLLDDLEIKTEEATYDRARDLITSPAEVTLRSPTLEVRGRGMEVEVGPQHLRLLENVHTVVRSDASAS